MKGKTEEETKKISKKCHKSPVGFRLDAMIKKLKKNTIVREKFLVDSILFLQNFFYVSLHRHQWVYIDISEPKLNIILGIIKKNYPCPNLLKYSRCFTLPICMISSSITSKTPYNYFVSGKLITWLGMKILQNVSNTIGSCSKTLLFWIKTK